MDARTIFWTLALANMAAAFALAAAGVYYIRAKQIEKHRRMMRYAGGLVGLFVAAYLIKVLTLGREDISAWDFASLAILRIHEGFVFLFLVTGIRAFYLSRKIISTPETDPLRKRHRLAGRFAMTFFALALLTAALTYRAILFEYGKTPATNITVR
ncbi:MAG: DUF420 domain-containing protein [Bdellovibrionota bacterium]